MAEIILPSRELILPWRRRRWQRRRRTFADLCRFVAGGVSTCGGKINTGNGKIAVNNGQSGGCGCSGGGAADPCANAPSTLAIVGYTDTYFDACTSCDLSVASDCPWGGVFYFVSNTTPCQYSNYQCFDGTLYNGQNCYDCEISGRRMCQVDPPGPSQITYDPTTGSFTLQITCFQGSTYSGYIVWAGEQSGTSFAGTYTRTGGCDTHPTITVG